MKLTPVLQMLQSERERGAEGVQHGSIIRTIIDATKA